MKSHWTEKEKKSKRGRRKERILVLVLDTWMRKFSEFGYCFGLAGVAVSPASNSVPAAASIRQRTSGSSTAAANRRYSRGVVTDPIKKKPRSSGLWRPSLSVIPEDRGGGPETRRKKSIMDIDHEESSRSPLNGGGSKRKSYSLTSIMAMPAFSPTPFMF